MRRSKLYAIVVLAAAAALTLAACGSGGPTTTTTRPNSTSSTASGTSASTVPQPPSSPVTLTEAGSSLVYPLFQLWAPAYHEQFPAVTISPAAGGSGKGIQGATSGTTDIGASDAYLSGAEVAATPALENIPLAISAQQVNYNLPGVKVHLKLDGSVLAGIYEGTVTAWNAPQISALNPGVGLPPTPIVPLHRSDSSGDSFLFTQYLSKADPSGWGTKYMFNTSYTGPALPGALAESGNGGMVTGCQSTPGCVAYIGISYQAQAQSAGLGEAMLRNAAGNYLLPTAQSVAAEAAGFTGQTPANEAISLIYGPAAQGYPIVNYEYAVVRTDQVDPARAQGMRAFFYWALDPTKGSAPSFLGQVQFQALPASVVKLSQAQIDKIK